MSENFENGAAPRGLLIDYGGVLTSSVMASFDAFCEEEGLSRDQLRKRLLGDSEAFELLGGLETGTLTEAEFERKLAPKLGVSETALIERMFAKLERNEAMLAAVDIARRAGIRTGLLSNSWSLGHYDRELLARLFDIAVISGEVGMRKPDSGIYVLALERIGLSGKEVVFVDDLDHNLAPATQLGIRVVHHRDTADTIAELEEIFSLNLR